jgi:hypothetical protein
MYERNSYKPKNVYRRPVNHLRRGRLALKLMRKRMESGTF